jgi:enoyl-CoA hydratase/carnithine racemase
LDARSGSEAGGNDASPFTPKMFNELAAAYSRLEESHDLRCGVLYAEGDHFTAGLDMPTIVPLRKAGKPLLPTSEVDPFNLRPPLRTKPVVAAMKGICFTVAIELMLAADVAAACRFAARGERGRPAAVRRSAWSSALVG